MAHTVIHFTDTAGFGGAEQSLLHLLAGLDRRTWQPVLFYHDEPGIAPLLARASSLDMPLQAVPRITTTIRFRNSAISSCHLSRPLDLGTGL